MASRPSRGRLPCAARPRVSISAHANPLCPTPICRSVGSVTIAASARPLRDERVGAEARVLLVDDRRDDQTSLPEAAIAREPRGVDHRGHAALHVLRAASIEPAVTLDGIERRGHAVDADGIDVPAQHQRAARLGAIEHADHVRPPRRRLLHLDAEPEPAHVHGDGLRDLRLAGGPGHERRVDRIDRDELAKQGDARISHYSDARGALRLRGLRPMHVGRRRSSMLAGRRRVTSLAGCGSLVTVLCANGSLARASR